MRSHYYQSPFASYSVGFACGCDSLNLQQSHTMVPDTTEPMVNATTIILKNRFHISALRSRYFPGSSPAPNTLEGTDIMIKVASVADRINGVLSNFSN